MDPVFQRLGDVTIQRLEKPKDKVGLQGNGDIMEKESKEERIEQNIHLNPEDPQGIKRNFENVAGPSTKRTKFEQQRHHMDEYSGHSFSENELTDYDTDSELDSDDEMHAMMKSQMSIPHLESGASELETSTDFLEKLVQEPFEEHESESLKSADEIKTEVDDYEYDIKEKLKEMGEISFETVKKGEKPKKTEMLAENEVVVTPAKKAAIIDEDPMGERLKSGNMRRNIREVMDETKLDESTLAAQRQEMERLRRVQEQQRIIREVQRQMAQDRVISLLQGGNAPKAGTSGARIGNTVLVKLPNGQTKTMTKLTKKPFDLVRMPKTTVPPHKAKGLIAIKKPASNLTPSVSIAPVMKRGPQHFARTPSDTDSENEDMSLMRRPIPRPKPKDPVTTIDISSDDDCIVVSESENDPSDDVDEDPSNSGMHTNDEFNQPDEQGRVVVNIGHPDGEQDIYLAPQIARIIKPHQIGGIRFLFDNVVESVDRFETSTGFGCILAHSMGLGKTLQVVSFSDIFLRHTPARTILCIMPINTLQNWLAEYNMWLPTEDACVNSPLNAHGEVRPRNFNLHVLNDSHKTLTARAKVINEWKKGGGVLLIGYEQYRLLSLRKHPKSRKKPVQQEPVDDDKNKKLFDDVHEALVKPGPDLVICDEGHRIKNSHASISQALKQMRTKRRVVLTGYPLQNNLMEYWCMVDFVRPNYLGTKTEFCNMFERPIQNGQCIDSTESDIKLMRYRAHVLHSLLVGFVQRRSHTVLQTALPQKEEYVLLVRMTDFQRTLYDVFMNEVVRTQTVPNPLKAFAVCCKIWNHPDVLYYFLKKQAGGEAVDIDLEEVSNSTASSNDSAAKTKKGSKKAAGKGKNSGKPAASITPYNSSGDATTKTPQKGKNSKNNANNSTQNSNQTPAQNTPNNSQNSNSNQQNFNQNNPPANFGQNNEPPSNNSTMNQVFNQNKHQEETFVQNTQNSPNNVTPGFQPKMEYNFSQNPPSNYSDSGFSQQSVEYSQNSQGSTFSAVPPIAQNPPSNLSQDSNFSSYSQPNTDQRFPNQPNFAANQYSQPSPSTFAPPATPQIKTEEYPAGTFPPEDFKSPSFQSTMNNFPDTPSQNFSLPSPAPSFTSDTSGYSSNTNQSSNFPQNVPPQSPNFTQNNVQNTNYQQNQGTNIMPLGNQNNFQSAPNQTANYPQTSGQNNTFSPNQNANFPVNNQGYPPNTQNSNFVQNNQGTTFNPNPNFNGGNNQNFSASNPQHFPQNNANSTSNCAPSNTTSFPQNNQGSNFSATTQNNFQPTSNQNAGYGTNTPSTFPQNNQNSNFPPQTQTGNFGSATPSGGNFPPNQILPPPEQSPGFRQNTLGNNFTPSDNFNQNQPGTFNPQNQQNTYNQPNFEQGYNPNNQQGGYTPSGTPAPSQGPPGGNFHNQQGNYTSNNQQSGFPQSNYPNNEPSQNQNFSPNTPGMSPSPAPSFQGSVPFPNNNGSANFASNTGGKSFSTNTSENIGQRTSSHQPGSFQPLISNQSSGFQSTTPNQPGNFQSTTPNQPGNFQSTTGNQAGNFQSTSPNQTSNFQSPTSFPTTPPQHGNFASPGNFPSNPNQHQFPPNTNQSTTYPPNTPSPNFQSPNSKNTNFPVNTNNQPQNFPLGPGNQPQNFPVSPNNQPQNFPVSPNNQPQNFPVSPNNQPPNFSVSSSNQPQNFPVNNQSPNFTSTNQPGNFPSNITQPQNQPNFPQNQPSGFQSNANQSGSFNTNTSPSPGFSPSNSNFQTTSGSSNQPQGMCNFPPNNQQNFPPNKQGSFPSTQPGNQPNQQGNFLVGDQPNFAQNQPGNFPMNQPGGFNPPTNFPATSSNNQGNFSQNTKQGNFSPNSNTNTQNQPQQQNQPFQQPSNFQSFSPTAESTNQQQSPAFWGQDANFKQPNDSFNTFRAPFNQNFSTGQSWLKKDDHKPIINSPIKLDGGPSESKPKINIISDIKLSSGGAFDMKKINILSDIKLDPKKEFEELKEEKIDVKSTKQELPPEHIEEEIKPVNEISPPAKIAVKEDTGIPYDWAIELLKDYVPGIIENSAKMEILFCIIKESIALGDRLLVFSQSLITLDLIEQFLQINVCPGETRNWAKNVNYYRLDGSTSALEREKLINEFNSNPKIYLFLVSTRAGSLGINLIGANRVVVLDASWNPCHDTQAVCRVYRYGQRKPLVVDNCLEKKIYDRQINKQGMSDRVVDECNPDAHLTMKDVSTLCWDDAEEAEVRDWSHCKDNYIDVVLQKVLVQYGTRLNKEPFQHESLLVDRKDKQLSQQEKRLAKKGYEREKQAARQPAYSVGSMARGHRPVASVRPMQQGGERPSRWIPAEHWQRQGMTAQEMTLPLDVVIPTNHSDKNNIVLKAGQKVLVLKSPKGVYMQLESGKIVAVKTAIKVRGKAEDDGGKVKATIPPSIKNNTALSVIPQKRAVRPFTPNVAKLNMRSVKQNVPNLVSRIQSVTKRVQTAKTKPYQIGQEIARAVNHAKSETESHPSSSDEERVQVEKRHFNFAKDSGLTIEPKMKSSADTSRSNSLERRDISSSEMEVGVPTVTKSKNYKSKGSKASTTALERLERSTSTIMAESKQTFQETLDSITSTYPEEEKLSDASSHASTTHSANQSSQSISSTTSDQEVIPVEDQPYQSESETPSSAPTESKTDIPTPEYGYNNYYGYNHMQPYPPPPQGYPGYPQPPPYDMMGYPQPQQPQYNYGMYPPQNYPPHQYPPQGPYDYGQPPPQGPVYPAYAPYPPQQYPPPPQGMYPPPGAPPPAGYPEYQYPPPPHTAGPPPPPAAPYYPGH
ncbi:SNF2-related domain [Popillia japonica]|uniref:SNF2-related domain n=1 Tax=Popillia japonica TaxID=7064 RepID=A0AAW1MNE9_POPJA